MGRLVEMLHQNYKDMEFTAEQRHENLVLVLVKLVGELEVDGEAWLRAAGVPIDDPLIDTTDKDRTWNTDERYMLLILRSNVQPDRLASALDSVCSTNSHTDAASRCACKQIEPFHGCCRMSSHSSWNIVWNGPDAVPSTDIQRSSHTTASSRERWPCSV